MTQCEHPFQCGSNLHNKKIWFVGRLCLAHVTYSYNFHGGIRHFGKQAQILKLLALSLIIAPNTSQDYFVPLTIPTIMITTNSRSAIN